MDNTLGDALATQIGSELNRSSRYTVLSGAADPVKTKLAELRTQGARNIDRNALAAWGQTNGISAICLVADDIKGSDHMFYAHLIDAKDSKVSGRGSYVRTSVTANDVTRVALALAKQLEGPGRVARKDVAPQQQWFEPELVFVEGGTFQMGYNSNIDDVKGFNMMSPHSVTLPNFYIGKYETTRAQWIAIMKGAKGRSGTTTYTQDISVPGTFTIDDQLPIGGVSWEDVTGKNGSVETETDIAEIEGYLERLNALTGKNYRLPTEEEWEYAARGGKHQSPYAYSGSNEYHLVGWTPQESGGTTRAVGGKLPNALGIYDMSGNGWEWCLECWRADYNSSTVNCAHHATRGGSWNSGGYQRIPSRINNSTTVRNPQIGFRVVLPAQ
jgi:formylglycine-generating enzyme required for sulfatase activity